MSTERVPFNVEMLEDLAPTDNIDQIDVYLKSLKWAFENPKIKNIALSGPYGSGKSSILNVFASSVCPKEYIRISLASFKEDDTSSNENSKGKKSLDEQKHEYQQKQEQHKLIEKSILQQLIYNVSWEDIPNSRFRRIKTIDNITLAYLTGISLLAISGLAFIFHPALFSEFPFLQKNRLVFAVAFLFIPLLQLASYLFVTIGNSSLSKIKLNSGEIEISPENESSILNKHLDEILYFFEKTKYRLVLLEDLDRFNDPDIFTKLREINGLINSSKQISQKVVFVYAIRDDIFEKSQNRTKFFDFILPVIPVINSSNASEVMVQKMKINGLHFNEQLIKDVTLYVSDMRMLKNILNEYFIYSESLKLINISQDKLLAVIIYKNIYPRDFANLHENSGLIYNVFENEKQQIIEELVKENQSRIGDVEQTIEKILHEYALNLRGLIDSYTMAITRKIGVSDDVHVVSLVINGSFKKLPNVTEEDLIWLGRQKLIKYRYATGGYSSYYSDETDFSFGIVEREVNSALSFQDRAELVKQKEQSAMERIHEELAELKRQQSLIRNKTLKQLLKDERRAFDMLSSELKSKVNRLLLYLVRAGYIDEMYQAFTSYFYEVSLSKKDMEFVLSIKDLLPLPFTHPLNNIEKVIERLGLEEFSSEAVLNHDLLNFLLQKDYQHRDRLRKVNSLLSMSTSTSFEFIWSFWERKDLRTNVFVRILSEDWSNFWFAVETKSEYSDLQKQEILKSLIMNLGVSELMKLNENNVLTAYISKLSDFLEVFSETNIAKVQEVIKELNIKFEALEIGADSQGSRQLFRYILETNCYALNLGMIELMLSNTLGSSFDARQLRLANYTTIKNSGCLTLVEYIRSNIDDYVTNVFLKISENTAESEDAIVELLNNENIAVENKEAVIEKQDARIRNINSVDAKVWKKLFAVDKIESNWENVFVYYGSFELDANLISFLNRISNCKALSVAKLRIENMDIFQMQDKIIASPEIKNDAFEYLLDSVHRVFHDTLTFENFTEPKVDALVRKKKLNFSRFNYDILKSKFKERHIRLIEDYIAPFLESYREFELDANDYTMLLQSINIPIDEKVTIILIIQNNYPEFITQSPNLATEIAKVLIARKNVVVTLDTVKRIITITKLPEREKMALVNLHIMDWNEDDIAQLLDYVGEPYSQFAQTTKHVKIPNDSLNREFIEKLEKKEVVSSYKIEDEVIRVIPKRQGKDVN